MTKTTESKIVDYESSDYTEITFQPDLAKFKMESLDKDTVALLTRRAYDIAGSTKGVRVSLNGNRLPVSRSGQWCVRAEWIKVRVQVLVLRLVA